jgi:ADP-L-glycero-D-manno-heptose 6-epimerase
MYVVTGGAGFIGSNVLRHMEAAGLGPLVCCDRLHHGGKWRNVAKRELFDMIAPDDLFPYLESHATVIEGVIHMGAVSSTTETDGDLIAATNIRLPVRLWEWCTRTHTRFIYASSAATYGDGAQGFDDDGSVEGLAKLLPMNAYGWSKHVFDRRVARLVAEGHPTPPQWAGLKFFNVYGPNEYHKGAQQSVVAHLVPQIQRNGRVELFKSHRADVDDGQQLRDFVHVDDCAQMVLWLLQSPDVSGLFNCGTGTARSFADLAHATFDALGTEAAIDFIPIPEAIRDKYQYFTEATMDRARAAGFTHPFRSIEDGVRSYVADYLDAEDPYA